MPKSKLNLANELFWCACVPFFRMLLLLLFGGISVSVDFGTSLLSQKREYDDNEFIWLHLNLLVHKAMQQFHIAHSLQYESRHSKCLFITQNVLCLGLCKPVYYVFLFSSLLCTKFCLVFCGRNL